MVKDHEGHEFESFTKMCAFYGIHRKTVSDRLKNGKTLEEALTEKVDRHAHGNICYDGYGNKFKTFVALCKHYDLPRTYARNNWNKMSFDELLKHNPNTIQKQIFTDYLGNIFTSFKQMCDYHHINYATVSSRLAKGMSLKDALTIPPKSKKTTFDIHTIITASKLEKTTFNIHNITDNFTQICRDNDVSPSTVRDKLKKGMSLNDAIEASKKLMIYDIFNNAFDSLSSMARCYNIPAATVINRNSKNVALSQILGIVPMPSELKRIDGSNYYLFEIEDYGEVVVTFETLEKYYISKFDQSKLDTSYITKE